MFWEPELWEPATHPFLSTCRCNCPVYTAYPVMYTFAAGGVTVTALIPIIERLSLSKIENGNRGPIGWELSMHGFGAPISMEGIEHVVNQTALLNEIVRITKPNGLICISAPNTSNFWSSLVFLFTGYFYQFNPMNFRVAKPDVLLDKGHISPISLYHLGYVMAVAGAGLLKATGDKYKKKVLLPLALLTYPFSYISAMRIKKKLSSDIIFDKSKPFPYFNLEIFLSRSLVAFFVRR